MDAEVSFLDPSVGWKCAVGCGSFVPFSLPRASASAVVTAPESFVPLPNLTLEQSSSLSLWVWDSEWFLWSLLAFLGL